MDWIKIKIETTPEGVEAVCARLYALGISGVEIHDARDLNEILSLDENRLYSVDEGLKLPEEGTAFVCAYIRNDEVSGDMISAIRGGLSALPALDAGTDFGSLEVTLSNVSEKDWENSWKQYFKPIRVGKRIFIRPEWETLPDAEGRIVFTVNPGMNFGTGTHATTQLCIEALEEFLRPGDRMLDIGCGSGILSVIALLLGGSHATAIDIDKNAAKSAAENARLNGIPDEKYIVLTGDIIKDPLSPPHDREYNIVAANIVADVIIPLAPKVPAYLTDGGYFIASGIIMERLPDVLAALEKSGLRHVKTAQKGDWAAVICQKA